MIVLVDRETVRLLLRSANNDKIPLSGIAVRQWGMWQFTSGKRVPAFTLLEHYVRQVNCESLLTETKGCFFTWPNQRTDSHTPL